MISFASDYIAGAHPEIIKRLTETNLESLPGYGTDEYCDSAKEKIKKAVGVEGAEVEFLVGGTQTNAVIISTMLHDYEGVIAAKTGHISVHEAGAIEYSGHEVLELPQKDGKLQAKDIESYLEVFYADDSYEHMTQPGMVYISHPTEYGTLYSKAELTDIAEVCKKYNIPLFLDGARLGYGLMSRSTDVTLHDIAKLCDVFYIGGTKVGALCGEAVVFTKGNKPKHFLTSIKRRGALLAKGRLLGIQFDTLFTDNLYFNISEHAIEMAEKLKEIIASHNIKFFIDSPTNQQFVILEDGQLEKLQKEVVYSFWEKYDETHTVIRLATSWSTTMEDLNALDKSLEACLWLRNTK
jgi:threonine aldolase